MYTEKDFKSVLTLRSQGLSLRHISKITSVKRTTVQSWCNGKKRPWSLWTDSEKKIRGNKIRKKKLGSKNPNWKGDSATPASGRGRAERNILSPSGFDRHHIDGNTLNNDPSNISITKRKEHQIRDGRYEELKARKTFENPWTIPEIKILSECLEANRSWNEISSMLPKRTLSAIKAKSWKLKRSGRYQKRMLDHNDYFCGRYLKGEKDCSG